MKKSQLPIKSSSPRRKSSKSLISPDLANLRQEIDILDKNIWSLFSQRFALTKKVAKIKQKLHISVYDAQREKAVLAEIRARTADPEIAAAIGKLYKLLFAASRKYQQSYTKNNANNGSNSKAKSTKRSFAAKN